MSNFFQNKFVQVAVLSLFVFAFALSAGASTPPVTPAMSSTAFSNAPSVPQAGQRMGNGPTMPPDPWAGIA
jgi:hypothetical protein